MPPSSGQASRIGWIIAALIAGVAVAIYYFREKSFKAQMYQLQIQVDEKSRKFQKALADLNEAKEAVEVAKQVKSEFLANMSHRLRAPLNTILGYTQILNRKNRLTRKQRKAFNTIHHNSEHLLMIINDILAFSEIETQKMELEHTDFNLRRYLWNMAEIARMHAQHQEISFDAELADDLPKRVYGDEKRLRQILLNLINNAVKFTRKGGMVLRVSRCDLRDVSPELRDSDTSPRVRVRFQVDDTGIGISPEDLEDIFHPFYSVKKSRAKSGGTGLGLAISQRLAHLMGSELHVKSAPRRGTAFWFDIDFSEAPEGEEQTETVTHNIVGFKGALCKILIADDTYENRVVLKEMLLPLGFGIIEAIDGFDVLAKAAQHHPDLILMDLMMPVLSGFEAIRHIRQMPGLSNVIVISVSATVFNQIQQESFRAGSDDFLAKPLRFDEVLEKLQRHLKLEWIYEESEGQDLKEKEEDN